MKSCRIGQFAVFCLFLSSVGVPSAFPQTSPTDRVRLLLRIKEVIEQGLRQNEADEITTRSTLEQALGMRDDDLAHENTKGAQIAQEAADDARQALARLAELRNENQQRLDAINRVLSTLDKQLGANGFAVPLLITGKVYMLTAQGRVPFDAGRFLRPGDSIFVAEGSYLELQLSDGHRLEFGENTQFKVEGIDDGNQSIYELIKGKLRMFGDCGTFDEEVCHIRVQMRHQHTIWTVRGTDYEARADASGLVITVSDGTIDVTKTDDRTHTISVNKGEQLTLPDDTLSGKPVPFDPKGISIWWK